MFETLLQAAARSAGFLSRRSQIHYHTESADKGLLDGRTIESHWAENDPGRSGGLIATELGRVCARSTDPTMPHTPIPERWAITDISARGCFCHIFPFLFRWTD